MKKGFCVRAMLSSSVMAAIAGSAAAETLFEENFRNYTDCAPGVVVKEGVGVGNDPIWRNEAELNVSTEEPLLVYDRPIALPKEGGFDFRFDFRLSGVSTNVPGGFDVVFSRGGKETRLAVTADEVPGAPGEKPVRPGEWHSLLFKTEGSSLFGQKMEVWLASDRAFRKLPADVDVVKSPDTVNFMARGGGRFSLTNIRLSTPEAVPDRSAAKHFASFRSLERKIAGGRSAAAGEKFAMPLNLTDGIEFCPGTTGRVGKVTVSFADGKTKDYKLEVCSVDESFPCPMFGQKKWTKLTLADALLSICGVRQFVRPHLKMYQSSYSIVPQGVDILRDWDSLPPASRHVYDVRMQKTEKGIDLWIDGSYAKTLENATAAEMEFAAGVVYARRKVHEPGGFAVLDFGANPRAKAFADGKLGGGLSAGEREIGGYPMRVADPIESADVAICHQGMGNWALEVEEYHGRAPTDGFPSGIHYRLPAAPYVRAGILFALDDDPSKDRILTLRLGQYEHNGSGGNKTDAVTLDFSNGVPDCCRQVGEVAKGGRSHPVYFMDVPLAIGGIIDLAANGKWLDFDITGKQWENMQQLDNTMKPDPNSDSAFNLFGVTLKRADYIPTQTQRNVGNVFNEDERERDTVFTVTALADGAAGSLEWSARGTDGKETFNGDESFKLSRKGDTKDIRIDFGSGTPRGFYELTVRAKDANGCELFTHKASFAILPDKKRNWEMHKSPYGTWWFSTHGSPGDENIGFPIISKAGIRKSGWREPKTREESEKWGVTRCGHVGSIGEREFDAETRRFKPGREWITDENGKRKAIELSGEERFLKKLKDNLDKSIYADHYMIWHESAPAGGIPEELLNLPVPEPSARIRQKCECMMETSRLLRKYYPDLRIQMGNASAGMGAAVWPLRLGASPDSFDVLGMETPAQTIPTERLTEVGLLGMLVSQDAASRLAKRKVPVSGAWEFTYRADRDIGEELQAEWHARDTLVCLAHRFTLIATGILFDCSNGYYNGLWGGSGLLHRAPYVYPKRAYVAYAVLTKELDDVIFEKSLPTGSGTVYAFQYHRADGRTVTALWCQRGEGEMEVESGGGTLTEMYGRETKLAEGAAKVAVSGAPVYLTTDRPVAGVKLVSRAFAQDQSLAAKSRIASAMDDASLFEPLAPDPEIESRHNRFFPYMKPSAFTIESVEDVEKGACVELKLDPANERKYTEYVTEYTTMRFKEPVPVEGEPELLGVWVSGNSNGGQIRFEIEDAKGEVFKNLSTGSSWACDIMDWPGNLAVNYDGWSFVYQTLGRPTDLIPTHSPGPVMEQWVSCGGDKRIDFPIKVRAITVGEYRYLFTPFGFDKSHQIESPIALKNLSGVYR